MAEKPSDWCMGTYFCHEKAVTLRISAFTPNIYHNSLRIMPSSNLLRTRILFGNLRFFRFFLPFVVLTTQNS